LGINERNGMARTDTETLPPPGNRSSLYDWPAIAERLKSEPLRWERVFDQGPYSTALSVKNEHNSHFRRDKGFEVTMRRNSPDRRPGVRRTCDLYIRYRPDWDTRLSPEQRTSLMDQARKDQKYAEDQRLG
jgi:hypothetical protein